LRAQTHKEPGGNGVVFDVMSPFVAGSRRTGVWLNAPVVNPGYIPKQHRARQSCGLELAEFFNRIGPN
jgi:hypothetical protein